MEEPTDRALHLNHVELWSSKMDVYTLLDNGHNYCLWLRQKTRGGIHRYVLVLLSATIDCGRYLQVSIDFRVPELENKYQVIHYISTKYVSWNLLLNDVF